MCSNTLDLIRSDVLEIFKAHYPDKVNEVLGASHFSVKTVGTDLQSLSDSFEKCQKLWNSSSPVFRGWKVKRIKVIEDLEILASEFDKNKLNCNIARLVGASTGAAGGAVALAGIIMAPFTLGASTPLIIAGSAMALSGGSVGLGAAITETALIVRDTKTFHALMLEHEEESKCLDEWVKGTSEFVAAVNKIVDVKIFKEIIEGVRTLSNGLSSSEKSEEAVRKAFVSFLITRILESVLPSLAMTAVSFFLFILSVPKIFLLACKVAELYDSDPLVFEAVMLSSKVVIQVLRTVDMGVDTVTTLISATRLTGAAVAGSLAKAVTHGALAGVGLALDITSIILASKSLHKGSKSIHAKQIREAKEMLEKGLEYLSDLSDGLCSLRETEIELKALSRKR